MVNKVKRQYINNIKKEINVPIYSKRRFLAVLNNNIDNYIIDNPLVDYDDLQTMFGKPDEVARAYYESLDENEIKQISKKSKLIIIIVLLLLLCGITYSSIYVRYYSDLTEDVPTYNMEYVKDLQE